MVQRQRVAKWFLILACLVVLTCTTQRMAGMHMLSKYLPTDDITATQTAVAPLGVGNQELPISPCELSAKSLLAANSMAVEHLFFALLLFVALLLEPTRRLYSLIPPPRAVSLPRLRVHLRLCVFRE
ncbi:copper resistance protein [Hafnia paralvei]|uniref:copper resistance protein n=1 Tax=Hafnia paralvei TaxID=546367 RepID=UPI00103475D1|nr:copper resistance protein [Hafnia paralvei]TBM17036.1 copper resistance protein [Hafnia paralvei]UBM39611.1 copper resistance protein [Hafnia paralvei]